MSTLKDYEDLFERLELTELSVKDGDLELTMKKEPYKKCPPPRPDFGPRPGMPPAAPQPAVASAPAAAPVTADTPQATETATAGNEADVIKSPLVGVFHAGEGVGAKPYVNVGDKVKKGDIICTVEAMKMFNDVMADKDGTIKEICVTEGALVEYGQILFELG